MEIELSEPLRIFIREYVKSLEELEVLLVMSDEPDRSWTAEEIFKMTQSNIVSIRGRLKSLAASGFLVENQGSAPGFRFCPKTPEMAERTSELKRLYAVSKFKVIEAIFSAPPHGQAQSFADSFKLKQKK